ncbi:MAG: hypothetical protein ABIB79_05400 [archaeon]
MEGELASMFIILFRGLVPFLILRWPLAGALLAIVGDIIDIFIFDMFGSGFLEGFGYHNFDKIFDMWYYIFEMIVIWRWKDKLARNTGAVLFGWRAAGFVIFEITKFKPIFFFAPNIFEFFFIATLVLKKFNRKFVYNYKNLILTLAIVGIPNIIKEYLMHCKYPDQTFDIIRDKFFWWLYG